MIIVAILIFLGTVSLGFAVWVAFVKKPPKPLVVPAGGGTEEPAPPPVEQSPTERTRQEVEQRTRDFIQAFNSNNVDFLEQYYTVSKRELIAVFESVVVNGEVRYANATIDSNISVSSSQDTAIVHIRYDLVRIDRATRSKREEPGKDKTLNWKKVGGAWVLVGRPEPY